MRDRPGCNPGATPATRSPAPVVRGFGRRISDFDCGLDNPQRSIDGSHAEPGRSRTDALAAGVVKGIDLVDHFVDMRYARS
jgi:hypothetical protein